MYQMVTHINLYENENRMEKKMRKWRIRRSTLDVVMLCISFYELTVVPHLLFLFIKYSVILYLLMSHCKECKKMRGVVEAILLYGGITFIATLRNHDSLNTCTASFIYMLHILAIYVTVSSFVHYREVEELIKCLIGTLLVFLFATDLLMLFINYNFSNPAEMYLIGNKFVVSYLHCFVTALVFSFNTKERNRKQFVLRLWRIVLLLLSIIICLRVTCTTGVLICLLMGAMNYFPIPIKLKSIAASPKTIIIVTAAINILVLGSFSLLTNPYIANFISNVLGKTITWVGRLHIYEIIFEVIKVHPWIGYGYYSNIVADLIGFGNAQNGVLKILVDSGIIGLIGYTLLVYCSMKKIEHLSIKQMWPMVAFIYCMIVASIAEINLTQYLIFLAFAIIFSVGVNYNNLDNKISKLER